MEATKRVGRPKGSTGSTAKPYGFQEHNINRDVPNTFTKLAAVCARLEADMVVSFPSDGDNNYVFKIVRGERSVSVVADFTESARIGSCKSYRVFGRGKPVEFTSIVDVEGFVDGAFR